MCQVRQLETEDNAPARYAVTVPFSLGLFKYQTAVFFVFVFVYCVRRFKIDCVSFGSVALYFLFSVHVTAVSLLLQVSGEL